MTAIPGPSGAEPGESRALAGYPVTPPALPRPVIFDQRWTDLTFIHWPVLPESVAGSYPPGTRPDVFADGMTYVGLVPFRMSSTQTRHRTADPVCRHLPGDQCPVVLH